LKRESSFKKIPKNKIPPQEATTMFLFEPMYTPLWALMLIVFIAFILGDRNATNRHRRDPYADAYTIATDVFIEHGIDQTTSREMAQKIQQSLRASWKVSQGG
jgi:hypothetical protein